MPDAVDIMEMVRLDFFYYLAQIAPAQTPIPVQPSAPPLAIIGGQPSAPPQQDEVIRSRTKFGFESQLTQCPHCHKQVGK